MVFYYAYGNYDDIRNTFDLFFDLQKNEGWTYASSTTWQHFLEYNLWFIVALWEYNLYSGDKDYIIEKYPKIKKMLEYFLGNLNDKYFIYSDACWMWTFPREGYSSAMQCILYKVLFDGQKIAETVDDNELSERLKGITFALKNNINKEFWDCEKGIYVDNIGLVETEKPVFLDVNCYAILFGISDKSKNERILSYIKQNMWTKYGSTTTDIKIKNAKLRDDLKTYAFIPLLKDSKAPNEDLVSALYPHNKQVWPFMNGYELECRFMMDDSSAFELIKNCWGNPKYRETGTFWEMFDIDSKEFSIRPFSLYDTSDSYNSESHGWSGIVSSMLQKYVLGIKPLEPGFKKVMVEPHLYGLKSVKGSVPTTNGEIAVSVDFLDNKWYIEICHPNGMEIEFSDISTCFKGSQIELKINEREGN